jgi:hypothetical protein
MSEPWSLAQRELERHFPSPGHLEHYVNRHAATKDEASVKYIKRLLDDTNSQVRY